MKKFPKKILKTLKAYALATGWEEEPIAPAGNEVLKLYKVTPNKVFHVTFCKKKNGDFFAPAHDATKLLNEFYVNNFEME